MFKKKKKEEFKMTEPSAEQVEEQVISEEVIEPEEIGVPEIESDNPASKELSQEDILKEKIAAVDSKLELLNEREKELRPKERYQVVKELPTAPVKQYQDKEGNIIHLITIEEYLTAQANSE